MNIYHVLNGDSLANRFPSELVGEHIICRECMVTGPVDGSSLQELYDNRKSHLEEFTGSTVDYEGAAIREFNQIINLPEGAEVNLWFEYDLFCQVNLWFVLYLLSIKDRQRQVHLVLPDERSPYGYHQYSNIELIELFNQRRELPLSAGLDQIWQAYVDRNAEQLSAFQAPLSAIDSLLGQAIILQIERIRADEDPILTKLRAIITELGTNEFKEIFREFQKRHLYYGLGDLQVKRYVDSILG